MQNNVLLDSAIAYDTALAEVLKAISNKDISPSEFRKLVADKVKTLRSNS